MNFNLGVFLIQSVGWLALLFAGFGLADQYLGLSDWEFIGALCCLAFSAYLVDEKFALSLLPMGFWHEQTQKK